VWKSRATFNLWFPGLKRDLGAQALDGYRFLVLNQSVRVLLDVIRHPASPEGKHVTG